MRKQITFTAVIIVLGVLAGQAQISRPAPKGIGRDTTDSIGGVGMRSLDFDYSFAVVENDADAGPTERWVAEPKELRSGTQFRVMIRSRQRVHAYLLVSARGGLFRLLRPSDSGTGSEVWAARNRWTSLPPGGDRLRLDSERGRERVYLVVSTEPVNAVEDVLDDEDGDPLVDEAWLANLFNQFGRGPDISRWLGTESTHVRVVCTWDAPPIAVERVTFRHR